VIHTGDCIEVMRGMEADSVDAVVTDPPYAISFMGRSWDSFAAERQQYHDPANKGQTVSPMVAPRYGSQPVAFQAWCEAWGREALRVTKPGGYLLAFGGTRTHHRLVCGLEDAGWIIRDELDWIYASGFPKGKANLKPAHEPIVLARKPGPLRPLAIDECRIPSVDGGGDRDGEASAERRYTDNGGTNLAPLPGPRGGDIAGRWPSNLLLSTPELFDQPNPYVVGSGATANSGWTNDDLAVDRDPTSFSVRKELAPGPHYGDSGGYSRFFIIPKADRADREPVLRGQPERPVDARMGLKNGGPGEPSKGSKEGYEYRPAVRANSHPTVKPTDLMRHLVRLVTPQGGTVLDCFAGSGSTLIAAEMEGFAWIGIEKEPEYVAIAEARLNGTQRGMGLIA
jgi:DNA modification methylase